MQEPFDWETPLALLKKAMELLKDAPARKGGSYFNSYVDVSSCWEALEEVVTSVQWEVDHP